MIADRIEHARLYYGLGAAFQRAFRLIEETDFSSYQPGTYEIDGKDLLLKIQEYETREPEACKIELHSLYADLHYIISGVEEFGYSHKSLCQPKVPYDPETEMALVSCNDLGFIIQRPGCFAIAFPEDAHQSARVHNRPCRMKKALLKIRL